MEEEIKYDNEDCQPFNESLDADGDIEIAGYPFTPSRILFDLDIQAYKEALFEFQEQDFERLKQTVFDYYPSCIAYNFRLSERGAGANDSVKKLLHLKDTWEAIIFVLYALTWAEVRKKGIDLKQAEVSYSGNPSNSFNTRILLSDAPKQKLENIKAIVIYSIANGLDLLSEQISVDLLDELLQLQDVRNHTSHSATPTREQAEEELSLVVPLFRKMLAKTQFLENCKVLRFDNYSSSCHCEVFNGHALNKEYEQINPPPHELTYIISLGNEQLFVHWDHEYFSLSPFLHFEPDATGHESYVCYFKGRRNSLFWFEPVKVRNEKTFNMLQTRFDAEKDELTSIIVP